MLLAHQSYQATPLQSQTQRYPPPQPQLPTPAESLGLTSTEGANVLKQALTSNQAHSLEGSDTQDTDTEFFGDWRDPTTGLALL